MRILLAFLLTPILGIAQDVDYSRIDASDASIDDQFGTAMESHGDLLVVGAPGRTVSSNSGAGSVYVFRLVGGTWTQEAILESPDPDTDDAFGSSVDVYVDRIVVGAPGDDQAGADAGAIYTFTYSGSWSTGSKVLPPQVSAGDEFGRSVAIYDTVIVSGAPYTDNGVGDEGCYYIIHSGAGGNTVDAQVFSPVAEQGNELFGYALDVEDTVVVIGATLDDDVAVDAGTGFVYHFDGTSWNYFQTITPSQGGIGHNFAFSLSVSQGRIASGAHGGNLGVSQGGNAYVYAWNGITWMEEQVLHPSDPAVGDWFAYSVDLQGNRLVMGAPFNDDYASEAGTAYLFSLDAYGWFEEFRFGDTLITALAEFGFSVALVSDGVFAGAHSASFQGIGSGSIYHFDLCTYNPGIELCVATTDSSSSQNLILPLPTRTIYTDSILYYNVDATPMLLGSSGYASREWMQPADVHWDSHSYSVATKNTCGQVDAMTTMQTTMVLTGQMNGGNAQLSWTPFSGYSFPYYRIYRDDDSSGNWTLVFATLSGQTSWTDPTTPASTQVRYLVEAQNTAPCTDLARDYPSSISNHLNPYFPIEEPIGMRENALAALEAYPNPTSGVMRLSHEVDGYRVLDATGRTTGVVGSDPTDKVDLTGLPAGIYLLEMESQGVTGRLVALKR